MQVRVMAACMESQADILECTASAQSGRREVMVCFSPMSMDILYLFLAPRIFPILYSLARPFLSEDTKRKIKILGSKYFVSKLSNLSKKMPLEDK